MRLLKCDLCRKPESKKLGAIMEFEVGNLHPSCWRDHRRELMGKAAPNKTARIKSRATKTTALRVSQTSKGVFWERENTRDGTRSHMISTSPQSALKLAEWIIENVEEEA